MNSHDATPQSQKPHFTRAQRTLGVLIVAYAIAAIYYKVIRADGLMHTSAMFIGLPFLLALLLTLSPPTKTAKGGIVRSITLALLLVAPLVGEGYVCILFAAPLFLGIGLLVGALIDRNRRIEAQNRTRLYVALLAIPLSLEGVVPQLTPNPRQSVTVTSIIAAPAASVEAALAQSPRLSTPLPRFLRIGFPRPLAATGSGLAPGSLRSIHFADAEGDPPGDLVMRVAARSPGHIRFVTTSDSSKLPQWLFWHSSDVSWTSIDAGHTRVTWTIQYDCYLNPIWYFGPWERFATRRAAQYLIRANATPQP